MQAKAHIIVARMCVMCASNVVQFWSRACWHAAIHHILSALHAQATLLCTAVYAFTTHTHTCSHTYAYIHTHFTLYAWHTRTNTHAHMNQYTLYTSHFTQMRAAIQRFKLPIYTLHQTHAHMNKHTTHFTFHTDACCHPALQTAYLHSAFNCLSLSPGKGPAACAWLGSFCDRCVHAKGLCVCVCVCSPVVLAFKARARVSREQESHQIPCCFLWKRHWLGFPFICNCVLAFDDFLGLKSLGRSVCSSCVERRVGQYRIYIIYIYVHRLWPYIWWFLCLANLYSGTAWLCVIHERLCNPEIILSRHRLWPYI